MVWRPKEKELTQEEAVAQAKKELAPFWIGSEPQLAAVRTPERLFIFPLDPEFTAHARMVMFADLTDLTFTQALKYAREWHHRYHAHGFNILLITQSRYSELRVPAVVGKMLKKHALLFPAMIDQDGLIAEALGARQLPSLVLLFQKKTIFTHGGNDWAIGTELAIQNHLRQSDPGLPLPPPLALEGRRVKNLPSIELGRGGNSEFPAPGFQIGANQLGSAVFSEELVAPLRSSGARPFKISGRWIQDGDRIMTSDPTAGLAFLSPGRDVAIVARSLSAEGGTARVTVELNGDPVIDVFCGDSLTPDEEGNSSVQVTGISSYYVLSGLPSDCRLVTLRFRHADRAAVALYGLRFSE